VYLKDLNTYDIRVKTVKLEFEGNITVEGEIITGSEIYKEKLSLSVLKLAVTHGKTILFQPEWGVYDMAG
jgi:phenylalanine-4-hydroxylase